MGAVEIVLRQIVAMRAAQPGQTGHARDARHVAGLAGADRGLVAAVAAAHFDRIQSVDSEKLLVALNRAAADLGRKLPVLLQINAGQDPAKFGAEPESALHLLEIALAQPGLQVDGLMTIAPLSPEHYRSDEEFLFALADELNKEYRAIIEAGLFLQVDDAYLATHYDVIGDYAKYREWAELRVTALNRALRGIPPERSRYHLCWGSWNGPHSNDIELARIVIGIAELFLDRLELFAQEVFALILADFRLHLRLDLRTDLEHFQLFDEEPVQHVRAGADVERLEHFLLDRRSQRRRHAREGCTGSAAR